MQRTTALAANQCWIGLLVVIGVQNIQQSSGILKHDTSFAVYLFPVATGALPVGLGIGLVGLALRLGTGLEFRLTCCG